MISGRKRADRSRRPDGGDRGPPGCFRLHWLEHCVETVAMTSDFAWYANTSMWCAVVGWLIAQSTKMVINFSRTGRIDFAALISTGGMPSAHCAAVAALATSVGLRSGFSSPLFATTLIMACIVMFDAQSVRLAAGHQARLLNQIVEELFHEHHFSQEKLAELLGHTRMEVLAGTFVGIASALAIHWLLG